MLISAIAAAIAALALALALAAPCPLCRVAPGYCIVD